MRELKRKKLDAHFAQIEKWYAESAELRESGPIEDMKAEYEAQVLGVAVPLIRLKDFLNNEYPWSMHDPQRLRDEIMEDLSPIVQPSNEAEVERALRKLVNKINDLKFYSPWGVTTISPKPKTTPELDKIIKNAPPGLFGPKQPERLAVEPWDRLSAKGPVLKIGGGKFVVHITFYFDLETLPIKRPDFYTIIIQTLTDGTFQKLKRCKECPRFFIADRLSDRFCRPECSRAFFSRDAVDRVRESREKAREKKHRVGKKRSRPLARPTKSQRKRQKLGPNVKVGRRPRKT